MRATSLAAGAWMGLDVALIMVVSKGAELLHVEIVSREPLHFAGPNFAGLYLKRSVFWRRSLGASLQGQREYLQRQLEAIGFRVLPGQVRRLHPGWLCWHRDGVSSDCRGFGTDVAGAASQSAHGMIKDQCSATFYFKPPPGTCLQGTYFLVADIRPLARQAAAAQQNGVSTSSSSGGSSGAAASETDVDFCQRLTTEAGVTLIPVRTLST